MDAAVKPYYLQQARAWIHAAEAQHVRVLVAFYHSEYTKTKLPSVATYKKDVAKFIKEFPKVKEYQAWDESNRGNVAHSFSSPSAASAAKYYQALIRVCNGCTVLGLDILDAANITPTLKYISEFKREISRLETVRPAISRAAQLLRCQPPGKRAHARARARPRRAGVADGDRRPREVRTGLLQPQRRRALASGESSQQDVRDRRRRLADQAPLHLRLDRWHREHRFDAGLMNARYQPRPGYLVVCKALRAAKCNQKVAHN